MMFPYCVSCQQMVMKNSLGDAFCVPCLEQFERCSRISSHDLKDRAGQLIRVHSVMEFDTARQLILNAKIGNDVGAVRALGQFFRKKIREISLDDFDVISAVPQSTYSRIRGRFDLADYFCECVKVEYQFQKIYFKTPFLWRFIKQSFRKSTQRKVENRIKLKEKFYSQENIRCLVVDDIVTTGSTILTMAEALPSNWKIEGCTFARACWV